MKKLLFLLLLITTMLTAFVLPVNAEETVRLINDGGFEEVKTPGELSSWDKYDYQKDNKSNSVTTFTVDEKVFAEGKQSAVLNSTGDNDARFMQTIPVEPNTYYKLSCKIKTENVGEDKKGANISVVNIFDTSKDIRGNSDGFEEVVLYGTTGPKQKEMNITAGIGGYGNENTGKAWFDDFKIEQLTAKPEGVTVAKFFKEDDKATTDGGANNTIFIIVLVGLILLVGGFVLSTFLLGKNKKGTEDLLVEEASSNKNTTLIKGKKNGITKEQIEMPEQKINKLKLGKKDFIIMSILTVVGAIIYFFNLGSFIAPQTFWQPTRVGEYVTFDLGKEYDVSKLMIFGGVNERYPGDDSKYRIEYQKPDGTFGFAENFNKDYRAALTWNTVNITKKTSKIKVIVDKSSGTLHEIAFYETGSKKPISGIKIIDQTKQLATEDKGTPSMLIDEQDTIPEKYTFLSGSYFDEIYHPRTAYEFIHGLSPYEITHPPLGKDLMSIGMLIFGAVPFGWRFIGVLFGVLNIPLMYLFGKKLFKKIFYATACGILIMFDFMNFTQSRIGLIDVYAVFFILLMYFFMYDYFMNRSYTLGYKNSLKPLLLSGVFLGIGAASKWIGLYAAAGLAFLFLWAKYSEYREYNYINSNRKIKKPSWFNEFIPVYMWKTLIMCIVFFVVIPSIIYMLSYIPYALAEQQNNRSFWDVIWENQGYMLGYHKGVTQTHPYQSEWWQWPIIFRPMWYFSGSDVAAGNTSTIVAMGNPAIWWTGTVTFILGSIMAIYKKHKYMAIVFVGAICQYFVWMLVTRTVYIYHFFSTVPFMIFTIVYVMKSMIEMYSEPRKKSMMIWLSIFYLAIVVALFILFYPAISGLEVNTNWIKMLKWTPFWQF